MKDLLMQFINVTYFLYLRLLEVYFYCICVSLCREWCESRGWKSYAKVKATGHGRIPEEALPIIVKAHGSRHCGGGRPWERFRQKQTIKLTISMYRWTVCQSERRIMIKVVNKIDHHEWSPMISDHRQWSVIITIINQWTSVINTIIFSDQWSSPRSSVIISDHLQLSSVIINY